VADAPPAYRSYPYEVVRRGKNGCLAEGLNMRVAMHATFLGMQKERRMTGYERKDNSGFISKALRVPVAAAK
jgi:hypothetical protein